MIRAKLHVVNQFVDQNFIVLIKYFFHVAQMNLITSKL